MKTVPNKIIQFRRESKNINNPVLNGKRWKNFQKIPYLTKPGVSLGYMCKNMIKLRGYDVVKSSFEMMRGQSDDIMVIDNDGDDSDELQELCREYGFRYFNVNSNQNYKWNFDIARVSNKIVDEAKHNIVVRLSPEILYPYNFVWSIQSFFQTHKPQKWFMCFRILNELQDGTVQFSFMEEWTMFKPFMKEARGWDERTSYFVLEDVYGFAIMSYVYGCNRYEPPFFYLKHRHHARGSGVRDNQKKVQKNTARWDWLDQLEKLKRNPKRFNRLVKNSLW